MCVYICTNIYIQTHTYHLYIRIYVAMMSLQHTGCEHARQHVVREKVRHCNRESVTLQLTVSQGFRMRGDVSFFPSSVGLQRAINASRLMLRGATGESAGEFGDAVTHDEGGGVAGAEATTACFLEELGISRPQVQHICLDSTQDFCIVVSFAGLFCLYLLIFETFLVHQLEKTAGEYCIFGSLLVLF